MLIKKVYHKGVRNRYGALIQCRFEGWFLFGFLLIYARQLEWPTNP